MFAGITAFVVHNQQDAQEITTHFLKFVKAFGLKINLKKTKVMYQTPPGSPDIGYDIQVEEQVLSQVNKFKYLGSTVANKNKLDAEPDTWMSNVTKTFDRPRKQKPLHKTKCTVL